MILMNTKKIYTLVKENELEEMEDLKNILLELAKVNFKSIEDIYKGINEYSKEVAEELYGDKIEFTGVKIDAYDEWLEILEKVINRYEENDNWRNDIEEEITSTVIGGSLDDYWNKDD
jgi:RNA binding exosome subunit